MKLISIYLNFVRERGRPLSEIYEGSNELALSVQDALHAVDILDLDGSTLYVVGGDVMTEDDNGDLAYVLHSWGYEYYHLNWSCDNMANESQQDYAKRSHIAAREAINTADDVAKCLGKKCYIVLVL